jgi:hypothetical protein
MMEDDSKYFLNTYYETVGQGEYSGELISSLLFRTCNLLPFQIFLLPLMDTLSRHR